MNDINTVATTDINTKPVTIINKCNKVCSSSQTLAESNTETHNVNKNSEISTNINVVSVLPTIQKCNKVCCSEQMAESNTEDKVCCSGHISEKSNTVETHSVNVKTHV